MNKYIMKKLIAVALLSVCILMLAACGQKTGAGDSSSTPTATPEVSATPEPSEEPSETPSSSGELKASDIYAKAMEETAKLDSYSINMFMEQKFEQGDNKFVVEYDVDMDAIVKPELAFKQTMIVDMMGDKVDMVMYVTKDGFFMKDPESGEWVALPLDMIDGDLDFSEEQYDPTVQLEKMKPFMDDFTMTDAGDHFEVKLVAEEGKFNEFIKNEVMGSMAGAMGGEDALGEIESLKISNVVYTFNIDKKTFLMKNMGIDMDLEIKEGGKVVRMQQKVKGTYSKFNEVPEIVVPQEALNAKPVQ